MKPNSPLNSKLSAYYDARISQYEEVYAKPERFDDLLRLRSLLCQDVANAHLLEIACGTGYWTQFASISASSITATDISESSLDFASRKTYNCPVMFRCVDAYDLTGFNNFSAVLSMFWWSHVPVASLHSFLQGAIQVTLPGGKLIFSDNRYVEGSSTKLSRMDIEGNTYQLRKIKNGDEYEVLKNFPSADNVREKLKEYCCNINIVELDYYWYVSAEVR